MGRTAGISRKPQGRESHPSVGLPICRISFRPYLVARRQGLSGGATVIIGCKALIASYSGAFRSAKAAEVPARTSPNRANHESPQYSSTAVGRPGCHATAREPDSLVVQ